MVGARGREARDEARYRASLCGGLLLREELDFYLKSEKEPLKG